MNRGVKGFSCVVLVGLACVLACSQGVWGAGFALYETGARANSLGSAMVGRADDPSAIFFNPAGITQLPGLQVMGGAIIIVPGTTVITEHPSIGENSNQTDGHVWFPPHLYATYQINNHLWFGFGLFSPFGLGTEFDGDWPGRFNSYKVVIQTLNVNPNIAWKINDEWSVAVGLDAMWFNLELRNKIDPRPVPAALRNDPSNFFNVDQRLTGDSWGFGGNVAVRYQPLDWLAFGASYRSRMKQTVEGRADFSRGGLGQLNPTVFRDTDATGSIVLPDEVFMGVTFYPSKVWSLELGAIWTNWSTFEELTIHYKDPIAPGVDSATREKKWNDVWRIHGGVEYKVCDWLDLRTGYEYDMEPVPDNHADYLVPANDRHLFAFGPGIHWGPWNFDLSYMYLLITDRDVEARVATDGVLESKFRDGDAHLFGFSITRKF
ncbi:MAG: OmpP1/FadL family transporter [Syntrophobacteraceae bacterium]